MRRLEAPALAERIDMTPRPLGTALAAFLTG